MPSTEVPVGISAILATRDLRFSRPTVISIRHDEKGIRFFEPGTITLMVSEAGSSVTNHVSDHVEHGNLAALDAMAEASVRQFAILGRRRRRLYGSLQQVPVLGEFRYARKTLRTGMFATSGLDLTTSKTLWNGGRLNLENFQFVEYTRVDAEQQLLAWIVVREPRLSDLEREILERVPGDASEIHLGDNSAALWTAAATRVAEWAAEALVDYVVEKAADYVVDKSAEWAHEAYDFAAEVVNQGADFVHDAADNVADFVNQAADIAAAAINAGADNAAVDNAYGVEQAANVEEAAAEDVGAEDAAVDEAAVAEAEGGGVLFRQAVENLSHANLSATASARVLLGLRSQFLVAGPGVGARRR